MSQELITKLYAEVASITDNLLDLKAFIQSPKFHTLSIKAQKLLKRQASIMKEYINVLQQRIITLRNDAVSTPTRT